jgi:hypothetical protein
MYLFRCCQVTIILVSMIITTLFSSCTDNNIGKNNRFIELLSLLPASTSTNGSFALIDYELVRNTNDIPLSDSSNNKISRDEFLNVFLSKITDGTFVNEQLLSLTSFYSGWDHYTFSSPIQVKNIGYDLTNIDAEINNVYTDSISDPMVSMIGRFYPKVIDAALSNQSGWPTWMKNNESRES